MTGVGRNGAAIQSPVLAHPLQPLHRNTRARIAFLAEALERHQASRPAQRRARLRRASCAALPDLWQCTGLCRVAHGLARLERAGVLKIMCRLMRQRVERISPLTGLPEDYTGTTRASSPYAFSRRVLGLITCRCLGAKPHRSHAGGNSA
jgi:hypothetical protein